MPVRGDAVQVLDAGQARAAPAPEVTGPVLGGAEHAECVAAGEGAEVVVAPPAVGQGRGELDPGELAARLARKVR